MCLPSSGDPCCARHSKGTPPPPSAATHPTHASAALQKERLPVILDIYTHIFPQPYFRALVAETAGLGALARRMQALPAAMDLDAWFRAMEGYGDYRQVISLPALPLEEVANPVLATRLARIANDGLADLVARHPDRFPAFVAPLR